jgi:hypothetical protein
MSDVDAGQPTSWEVFSTASYKAYTSFYEKDANKNSEMTIQMAPEPVIEKPITGEMGFVMVLVFVLAVKAIKDSTQ